MTQQHHHPHVRAATHHASALERLHPAYFALVMATGIVSIAAEIYDFRRIALTLLAINVIAYVGLWIAMVARMTRYPHSFVTDIADHARGPGFFTWVAGTGVLGVQFVIVVHLPAVALAFWVLTVLLWVIVVYAIFTALSVRHSKPKLEEGLNGGWLVAIVATQSVAVLSTRVAAVLPAEHRQILLLALGSWLFGGMLYIWVISLIFYRYTFLKFTPADLTPPYWINMGAMAISTLAGDVLIHSAPTDPLLSALMPFLKGLTLMFWATATWWIPLLLILGVWRYVIKRFPFEYDPLYWGMVFPLGMYTVCTNQLTRVMHLPFLRGVPDFFVYVALLAWSATFLSWLKQAIVPTCVAAIRGRAISPPT